jgi:hypothetical protein
MRKPREEEKVVGTDRWLRADEPETMAEDLYYD